MRISFLHTVSLLAIFCIAFSASGQNRPASPLSLEIIVPPATSTGERTLYMAKYPRFHVLVTNNSDAPVRLWKDWTSWGYATLSFLMQTDDKTIAFVRPVIKRIDGDFPDFWALNPGDKLILEVDMSTGQWRGMPDLYGESLPCLLQAVLEIKQDFLTDELGIWTGRIQSNPAPVIFK